MAEAHKSSIKIGVIVASTRPKRIGRTIADWVMTQLKDVEGADFELIDLKEIDLPFLNEPESPSNHHYQYEHTKNWSKIIDACDGFIFVTAEYNNGYPAPLKNAIDTVYDEWAKKPVGFVGYGTVGAARAIEQLVVVASKIYMVPLSASSVKIIGGASALDEHGNVKSDLMRGNVENMAKDVIYWAKLLKPARQTK